MAAKDGPFGASQGQAMIELLPSMTLIVVILSASLAYFRSMRESVERQEVVRNILYAKISNMGTLTTPNSQVRAGSTGDQMSAVQVSDAQPISQDQNVFIDQNKNCFSVLLYPGALVIGRIPLIGDLLGPNIVTGASIYRNPAGSCP